MPSSESDTNRFKPEARGADPVDSQPGGGREWPASEPEPADPGLAEVARLLAQVQPRFEPVRPAFEQAQRVAFIRRAAARQAEEQPMTPRVQPARVDETPAWLQPVETLRAALGRWALPLAAGAALAAVVLVGLVLPRLPGAGPTLPPPIARDDLLARNAAAWDDLQGLTGAFTTGDGWYYEEWISRQPDGGLRYKRFIRPPERTPNRPQWNVSDGRTEWVVDAATREIRFTRPAVPGDFTAVAPNDTMQCTALALPPTMDTGSAPIPALVGDRPAYRIDGTLVDGSPGTFWLDARDHLVFRIDRPGLGTVWERGELDLNPPLADAVFSPDNLTNL